MKDKKLLHSESIIKAYKKYYNSNLCIACDAEMNIYAEIFSDVFHDDFSQKATIIYCANCGLGYTYPFLEKKELDKLYVQYDPHIHHEELENKSIWYKIFCFIEERVFNFCIKTGSTFYKKVATSFLFQRFFQTYPLFTQMKNRKLKVLDFGCGGGYFLQLAKKAGCEVYGVEVEENLVRKLNKQGIIATLSIKDFEDKKMKFDIIRANQVLEHVKNPNELLQSFHKLLGKEGELIIGVPNYNTLAKSYNENFFMHLPFHRLHYTKKSMSNLLQKNKFYLAHARTKSSGLFTLSYLRSKRIPISSKTIPLRLLEIISLSLILDAFKIGDGLEIYGKKL